MPLSVSAPARRRAVRAGLAGLALLLAVLPVAEHRRLAAGQARLLAWLEEVEGGPVRPELAREIAREPDLERAKVVAAREVLATELDPERFAGLSPAEAREEARAGARRLGETAALAAGALATRPAAWEAAMVLGGATYLARAGVEDARLLTAHEDWELPLQSARALGKDRHEPRQLLAAAYLELWWALSPGKRQEARGVLASALQDPAGFRGLIGPWLEVAPSREAALSLVPDDPDAWVRLQDLFAGRGDWEGYLGARDRRRRALARRLAADLGDAEERLHGGDPEGARDLFLKVAARVERGARGADLLQRALDQAPPGPVDRGTAGQLAGQLDWVLDRCVASGCPLDRAALRRLTRFCRDLDPPQEALASLLAGDLDRAELTEQRAAQQWSEAWAPYLVAKARLLAERGKVAEAAEAMALVHRAWHARPSYWRARAELARAAVDPAAEAAARQELARLAAFERPGTAWTFRRGRARLELLAPGDAAGLRIGIDEAPEQGAAVELRLDGAPLGTGVARRGGTLAFDAPVPAGLHVLEIESLAGGAVAPGDVRLAPVGGAAVVPANKKPASHRETG